MKELAWQYWPAFRKDSGMQFRVVQWSIAGRVMPGRRHDWSACLKTKRSDEDLEGQGRWHCLACANFPDFLATFQPHHVLPSHPVEVPTQPVVPPRRFRHLRYFYQFEVPNNLPSSLNGSLFYIILFISVLCHGSTA
jgi:hypothetical protein